MTNVFYGLNGGIGRFLQPTVICLNKTPNARPPKNKNPAAAGLIVGLDGTQAAGGT